MVSTHRSAGASAAALGAVLGLAACDADIATTEPATAQQAAAVPQMAVYDAPLKAPACRSPAWSCDSGTLVQGRWFLGPEPNTPNTIHGDCEDSVGGTYHIDESLDRVVVSTVAGTPLMPGATVRIDATLWKSPTGNDRIDLYYAADANAPAWVFIATVLPWFPQSAGSETLSATYALPAGPLQAVRAQVRSGGTASPCTTGPRNDRDDLVFTVVSGDDAPPATTITSPAPGTTVSVPTQIAATASDDLGISQVEFYRDATVLLATATSAPYKVWFNPYGMSNGTHLVTARAYDTTGHTAVSVAVAVNVVDPDPGPPQVVVSYPAVNMTMTRFVTLGATAIDGDDAIASVEFFVDGAPVGTSIAAPYTQPWDSTTVANGAHAFTARACDVAGHCVGSGVATAYVSNDLSIPFTVLTSPVAYTVVSGTIELAATATDDIGVERVEFYVDGGTLIGTDTTPPYVVAWDATTVPDGYHLVRSRAYDGDGHSSDSAPVTLLFKADPTPPTTALTAPAAGSVVSGAVQLAADAADNKAVTEVKFYLDGTILLGAATASPYLASWSTAGVANGVHALTSVARDAAGNTATSAPVTITIANATLPALISQYDFAVSTQRCVGIGSSCDTAGALAGRGNFESAMPNTIDHQCADGTTGNYHVDESLDRLTVSTLTGAGFAPGTTVRIDAVVWAYAAFTSDQLDLYYTATTASPSWVLIGTLTPSKAGLQTLSTTYVLPSGQLQAIRGQFRYGTAAGSCTSGPYNDRDDLVFAVQQ